MSLYKLYRVSNLLSLDVVLGAVCGALFFAKATGRQIEWPSLIVLALTVWIIYTVDHLLDANKIQTEPSGQRHLFHRKNKALLKICVMICVFVTTILLIFIPWRIIIQGSVLLIVAGSYLLLQFKIKFLKEFLIAVIYTLGIVVPGISIFQIDSVVLLLLTAFSLTAFLNLVVFSWFDYDQDRNNNSPSLITTLGKPFGKKFIWSLYFIISLLVFAKGMQTPFIIIWLIATGHVIVFFFHDYFGINERFRPVCEALFFLPIVYWLL
jgi:4-hydroxybenzoate polyprenyltransferase